MAERDGREHGLIFGRGDDVDEDAQEPPSSPRFGAWNGIPVYNGPPIPFGEPPPEPVKLVGDVPWELQEGPDAADEPDAPDDADSGPSSHAST
jgi:hypothetical protein